MRRALKLHSPAEKPKKKRAKRVVKRRPPTHMQRLADGVEGINAEVVQLNAAFTGDALTWKMDPDQFDQLIAAVRSVSDAVTELRDDLQVRLH